ncbi:MAG TPA: HEAT repeat domain-containing protein [Deltaproteobacteria bacterium]|nr:HEAT repeat domain-containing protein [Deltaproteobacteria bacterium]
MSDCRDVGQWFKASFVATLACIIWYTAFGLIFVRFHAGMLATQMHLMLSYDMVPLVMPDDPYLTGIIHQLSSALFFGCTLGVLCAIIAMITSLVPWIHGRFSRFNMFTYVLLGCLFTYLSFSAELPAVSIVFAFICPLIFFVPWAYIIRRSSAEMIHYKRWIVMAFILASPFFGLVVFNAASFEIIRDSMLEIPVARSLSDFYYDHTYLAAHVIKPIAAYEQKVIAVSDDVRMIGPMPHGTLWIRSADPCSIKGRTLTASRGRLACDSIVIPDGKPANVRNRIIKELGSSYDYNNKMRSGIGLFFYNGPLAAIPLLFLLWLAYGISGLYDKSRIAALLIILGYLALFVPPFHTAVLQRQLLKHPQRIHAYILAEQEQKRYLALKAFPGEFKESELVKFSHDASARIRLNALYEMGMRKNEVFMDVLSAALDDPQLNVRTRACWALGNIASKDALSLLENVVRQDPSWYVRGYAYRAIGRVRPVSRSVSVKAPARH